jgi:hypothetical protein
MPASSGFPDLGQPFAAWATARFDEPSMGGHAIRENLKFAKASIKKTKTAE